MQRRIVWKSHTEFDIEPPILDPGELLAFVVHSAEYHAAQRLWQERVFPENMLVAHGDDLVLSDQPLAEVDHFAVCKTCGQAYDRRELGVVMHHLQARHRSLPLSS